MRKPNLAAWSLASDTRVTVLSAVPQSTCRQCLGAVARYAHCSVLVARSDKTERVIVAVDDSEASEHALDALAWLPLPAALEITVVHVLRPSDLMPPCTWEMV
jgi:nucleotide-binding universal stress UspA family protein